MEKESAGILHRVQKGENLYRLGEKYQVTVTAILDANPYTDAYQLQEGDEILIPKIPVS